MKATEVPLNSFLSQNKTQFIIPVYQRNYDWAEPQCRQLLDDILNVGQKQGETHFIGSIVFIHDGVYTSSDVRQLVVIDGQQRLTTFSLLYLALYRFAMLNDLEEKAAEIKETFIVNKFVKDDESKLKLKQSDVNAKAFNFLLNDNDSKHYSDYSKVIDNFTFFFNGINADNFATIIKGISSLLFVEISLERGKDDPQRIFESLNSTGLELSQADLIRNYILMGLDPKKQIKIFDTYWQVIEQNARDEEKEESRVSEFIRDYLTFKTKKIPTKSKVYEEFKARYSMKDDQFYTKTLPELKDFSFYYNRLINPHSEQDSEIRKELIFIQGLEINIAFPFLLPIFHDYATGNLPREEFKGILKLIQSFTWRRFIVGLATAALNKIFMTLYNEVDKENYLNSIAKTLIKKKSTQRFPLDSEIKLALAEKDVYAIQPKNRIYLFELLENHNNREYVSVSTPDITVEHIYPQTPDEKWNNSLDPDSIKAFNEKYINTLANLTLSGNNGSLGNKSFLEKRDMNREGKQQGYSFSRLWLNQYLRSIDKWTIENLNERYSILLARFLEIWPYPAIELDDDIDLDEEYTILNAPDPKYRKLDYFVFKDEKIETEDVAAMYYHVVKSLFTENPSVFYHQEMKNLLGLTTNRNELRTAYSISPTYYIETNIDNVTKFRRLRILLTKFGYEDELLINFSNYEPEQLPAESIDRNYWNKKELTDGLDIVDKCESIIKGLDKIVIAHYTARYICLKENVKGNNFVRFFPKKKFVRVAILLDDVDGWINQLKAHNIEFLSVGQIGGRLKFRLTKDDIVNKSKFFETMFRSSYEFSMN